MSTMMICGCPDQPEARVKALVHEPGCLLNPAEHRVTLEPGAAPKNWTITCSCMPSVFASLAGFTLAAARQVAADTPMQHADRLRLRFEADEAELDLEHVESRAEAARLLAAAAGLDALDPEDSVACRAAYVTAREERGHTIPWCSTVLMIALGEMHPPAATPRKRLEVLTLEVPILSIGEGPRTPMADVAAEIAEALPAWLTELDEDDPAAWAIGEPRMATPDPTGPQMVDLTRPGRKLHQGYGRVTWVPEETRRVEFGQHWESGWYVADDRPEVSTWRGPYESAQAALVGVVMEPGMTVSHVGG